MNRILTTLTLAALLPAAPAIFAEDEANTAPAEDAVSTEAAAGAPAPDHDDLAKKLSNPLANMISVPFQNNFDWGGGPNGDGFQYKLNVQPVIPFELNEDWNLVTRTIIPFITQNDIAGTPQNPSGQQTGLGDISFSAWLSPPDPTESGWIWGVGPAALLNTGTDPDNFIGGNQWGLGPSAVVLKQEGHLTYGFLANHLWNIGGTDGRPETNATYLQPFLSYNPGGGWTFLADLETTYDWTGDQFTIPINMSVKKMFKIGQINAQWELGGRYYADKGDQGPEWGVRASITLLFPE